MRIQFFLPFFVLAQVKVLKRCNLLIRCSNFFLYLSTETFMIISGDFLATSSMLTPPSAALAIRTGP